MGVCCCLRCFLELISEFRDHFCAQLDNAQTGIRATLRRLMQLLQHCDYALWQHIEVTSKVCGRCVETWAPRIQKDAATLTSLRALRAQVDPQYYAFRWITLLLSQEFPFDDTLRIWDTILSDPHGRMDCLLRICAAMVIHVKPRLMQVKGRPQQCLGVLLCGNCAAAAGPQRAARVLRGPFRRRRATSPPS